MNWTGGALVRGKKSKSRLQLHKASVPRGGTEQCFFEKQRRSKLVALMRSGGGGGGGGAESKPAAVDLDFDLDIDVDFASFVDDDEESSSGAGNGESGRGERGGDIGPDGAADARPRNHPRWPAHSEEQDAVEIGDSDPEDPDDYSPAMALSTPMGIAGPAKRGHRERAASCSPARAPARGQRSLRVPAEGPIARPTAPYGQ